MWKRVALAGFILSQTPIFSNYIPPSNQCQLKMFAGSGSKELANEVAGILGVNLGRVQLGHFSDGETRVNVLEDVSGRDVFVIASLGHPVQENLMELLLLLSALKRANCNKIVLVIPYLAYNRQDLAVPGSLYVPAEDIPKLIDCFEANLIIGVDFHGKHIDGHFVTPVQEISPYSIAVEYLKRKVLMHPVVLSPDIRGSSRAYEFYQLMKAEGINCDLAIVPNPGSKLAYVGDDIGYHGDVLTGRDVIIIDDMVISGSTILKCLAQVRQKDAEKIYCFATHPVLSEGAVGRINKSSLTEYICTNTLPIQEKSAKIVQLSVANLIAKKIYEVFEAS